MPPVWQAQMANPLNNSRKDEIMITQTSNKRQVDILLDYLLVHGSVTGMECIELLGIMNYKGRILDLRKMGYAIKTKMEIGTKRDGSPCVYARYELRCGNA